MSLLRIGREEIGFDSSSCRFGVKRKERDMSFTLSSSVRFHVYPSHSPCRVSITFVNYAGERTKLPGRVGDSLLDVARRYKYDFVDGA